MRYKSPFPCEHTGCSKGAQFVHGREKLCESHTKQRLLQAFVANNPGCIILSEVRIGGTTHKVTPEQLDQIQAILGRVS